jgi:hypothetical protein
VSTDPFIWWSARGGSVALFLLSGAVYILIGAGAPIDGRSATPHGFITASLDAVARRIGKSPDELQRERAVTTLRILLLDWTGGLMVMAGLFQLSLAWYGVRNGEGWAYGTLVAGHLAMSAFWVMITQPYRGSKAPFRLRQLPLVLWIPTCAVIPAAILGWMGL